MTTIKFQLPFVKKEQLTLDTYTFYFDRSAFKFDFLAGQYFRDTLQIENPDERGSSRYFSASSSPLDPFLTITTRVIKSSYKLKLKSLEPGEKMTFFGPFGDITQEEKDLSPKIHLAGGIGVTPAHSMLRFIDQKKIKADFTLFVSSPTKSEALFYDELREIESRLTNIKVIYTLTKDKIKGFENGRINAEMIQKYAPGFKSSKIYITGPLVMVEAMTEVVKGLGATEKNIVPEDFPGY